jgi:hypothetical protein
MADRFKIGEILKCDDFVGRYSGREELLNGVTTLYLWKKSFVQIGESWFQIDDFRLAPEHLCESAAPPIN